MGKKTVHVVGTGTIGEPLIGMLADMKGSLGIDEVTYHKNTPRITDRPKLNALIKRGAKLAVDKESFEDFKGIGITPDLETVDAINNADVVIDCTPSGVGHANKHKYYESFTHNTLGFIAQGSEFGFGKMYARGINDEVINRDDQFIQVVSCNTHNLSVLLKTLALYNDKESNLEEGRFVCIRRANDISQGGNFIPAPMVGKHGDSTYGSHHARDAAELYKTLGYDLNLFSSALKLNTQYMHTIWFDIKLLEPTTLDTVFERLEMNDLVSLNSKNMSNLVFSFGRDHGHYGRILNQTVVVRDTLAVRNGNEIVGFCFTPQDGNAILSSIAATVRYLYPDNYHDRIQTLAPFFFDEV